MTELNLTINNTPYTLPEIPGEKLSSLLRDRLHLTGTKIGCGEGVCGICTVIVDGKPVKSCLYPASKANHKSILTIEGIRSVWNNSTLHPLQQAFIDYGAIQCGFCTPAQIVSAFACLQNNPDPSYEELKTALSEVLCRCGSYEAILKAVMAAAKSMRNEESIEQPQSDQYCSPTGFHTVGSLVPRPDAVAKATGEAKYTDDLFFEGMLCARVVRAGLPHGILRSIEIKKALSLPGVEIILTARDLPAGRKHGLFTLDWPVLVGIGERVRYMGDAVALVAANNPRVADEAAGLIHCEFDPEPVISNPAQARSPSAAIIHDGGNLLKHIKVRKGSSKTGFTDSDIILEQTFHTPFTDHLFMEPECSIAVPLPDGRMDIYVGSQIPYADRIQVAAVLGVGEEKIRIRGQLTGGGFGGKEDIAGQIHAALLAKFTGKPVKLLFTRRESLLVHPKRHATQIRVRLGAKADGHLIAAETELLGDTGAYASLGEKVMTRATTHSTGPYIIPHVTSDCYAMYTNNPPAGAFRGFGVLQSAFAIESMMDMLAHELGIDPLTIRKMNALTPGSLTNTGQKLDDSVGLMECLEQVESHLQRIAGPKPFAPISLKRDGEDYLTCWGVAAAFKNTGLGSGADDAGGADIELRLDGSMQLRSAAAEIGQGLTTTLQMITAEVFKREPQDISILLMDTDLTPDSGPTTASRQTFVTGNAALQAALNLKKRIVGVCQSHFRVSPEKIEVGGEGVVCDSFQLSWVEVAELMERYQVERTERMIYHAPKTVPLGSGAKIHFAYSFSAQAVQLEIGLTNGVLRVLQVISANDAGKIINPLGFHGQVEGGVVMGVGHGLMEEFRVVEGIIHSDRMARYRVPRMLDSPHVISIVVERPTREGPFGAKGVGEIVSIPTPPAIANALFNAIGMRVDKLPIRSEDVLKFLRTHPLTND